jgi:DNA-binding protein
MAQSPEELRLDIERTRANLGETLEAIGDRVSPGRIVERRTQRVRNRLSSMKVAVMGSAQNASGAVSGGAASAAGAAQSTAQGALGAAGIAVDQVREAPQAVRRQTQGNPLAAGFVAFGTGLLVASLLPTTEAEQQLSQTLSDQLEPVKEHAQQAVQELKEGMSEVAAQATGQVKDQAAQAAEAVKDQTRTATEEVKSQAQSSASAVRDEQQS